MRYTLRQANCGVECGMHQPVPEPADIRGLPPEGLLAWLCAVQRALGAMPDHGSASVSQYRPGVVKVADEGVYSHVVTIGLDGILDDLVESGAIERT